MRWINGKPFIKSKVILCFITLYDKYYINVAVFFTNFICVFICMSFKFEVRECIFLFTGLKDAAANVYSRLSTSIYTYRFS